MAIKLHDWMDDWFLALSENPDKLNKAIKRYEVTRSFGLIGTLVGLAMYMYGVLMSGNDPKNYNFMFIILVWLSVLLFHMDTYTKILKLQRRQQKIDPNDTKPHSDKVEKNSLSEVASIYGWLFLAVLSVVLVGALIMMTI